MDGDQARELVTRLLMERVREDTYPSATHMEILENTLPDHMLGEYLEILVEKVESESWPSTTMLKRIQRVAAAI